MALALVVQVFVLLWDMSKFLIIGEGIVLQIEKQKFDICETETLFWLEVQNSVEVEIGDIYNKNTQTFFKPYTLNQKKVETIQTINDYCGFVITQEYPLWRQLNVTNGLDIDISLETMQSFIQVKRNKARELRGQVETIDNFKGLKELMDNLQNLFD